MGVYDELQCHAPLPDGFDPEGAIRFQTKDLACAFNLYRITREGELLCCDRKYEVVPPEERPFWGDKEWEDSPLHQLIGSLRAREQGWTPVDDFTGSVRFYWTNLTAVGPSGVDTANGHAPVRHEYVARFQSGRLSELSGGRTLLEEAEGSEASRENG